MNSTSCPNCHTRHDVPAHYKGRQVRCRSCGSDFTAVFEVSPPAIPRSPSDEIPKWGWILIGLTLAVIAIAYGWLSGFIPACINFLHSFATNALPGLLILLLLAVIYFLPTIAAKGCPRVMAVFLANLFFGWTGIGWILVMIWAVAESGTAAAKRRGP